jgi:hypothetical protein
LPFFTALDCILSAHLTQLTFPLRQLTLWLDRKLKATAWAGWLWLESSEAHWALPD